MLPHQSLVTLIIDAGGTPRVPAAETTINAEDEIVAVTRTENEDTLRAVFTSPAGGA
jgi:Trk K+ transport system NAD-binding subunit